MNDYIYHYTSIETLALILKNKKIRFNSLKNVDDINETQFSDENDVNLSSHTLISCWTNNEEENLAFWNMYTPNMKGVRIKISKNLFQEYSFNTEYVIDIQNSLITNSLVPKTECFNSNYWIIPFSENFLEVIYTDQDDLLKPQIVKIENENFTIKTGEIGRYKSKIWEFQKEVRFKLFILPTKDLYGNQIHPLNNFQTIIDDKIPCPIDNYFIDIRDDAFKNMEVTLGPKCTFSEEIIVEALLEKYNPNAKISKNKFQGLIR
ncbi:hypothetical protein CQ046_12690 [Chryseobacterium sp. MYb7]|uniref:DUF2971 domain-containing protein n=1 Tax=Chryseobacterium sp. MYb7 TaxID=1827290 RepID=UPI000D0026FF|nr:DUF2971 domain-containing protein [Chryseobacterium sp. MYb7]PRB02412.1 hypothetical protein CQ046_12690 [Chryseobacterium sp. MYb7]